MAANDFERGSAQEFLRLLAEDPAFIRRLTQPVRLALPTPFTYPGAGAVVLFLLSDGSRVRLSEGGRLLRFLESQGMGMGQDPVISKTVFHALKDTPGAGLGGGQLYLDATPESVAADAPRFLQVLLEVVGLRHSKYKDALVSLSHPARPETRSERDKPAFWDAD